MCTWQISEAENEEKDKQIPPQLREFRKTLFKRKLHELLLKVLETEEVYVDINAVTRINLMSLLS